MWYDRCSRAGRTGPRDKEPRTVLTQRELIHALKINRIAEQVAGALDQNVRRAMQEQAKVLDTALQSHLRVLQAAVLNIPKQWVRVDIPPPMRNVDLASLASFAERIQKALPQLNEACASNITLPTITQPPHNSIITSAPYTDFAFGDNSQYPDNEEEPPDSATDIKSSTEHSGCCYNYQRQLGQDWITVIHVTLATGIAYRVVDIPGVLEEWEQRWDEPVAWAVIGFLTYWLTVRRTKQGRRK